MTRSGGGGAGECAQTGEDRLSPESYQHDSTRV